MIANENTLPPAIEPVIALTPAGDKWRVCIVPPVAGLSPFKQYDEADAALGYGARIAFQTGWRLIDQTGRRSESELLEFIEMAGREGAEDGCLAAGAKSQIVTRRIIPAIARISV